MLEALLDAVLDPWPPFTFCCPQAIVDEEAGVSIPNSSPFSRSTRFPFTSTASPPAPLAIRKAPSASVESIQPRPPQPCEVGRPKGRRRKNRRQSHTFFLAPAAPVRATASQGRDAFTSTFLPCLIKPIGPNNTVRATAVPTFP